MANTEETKRRIRDEINRIAGRHHRRADGRLPPAFWADVRVYFFKLYLQSGWPLWSLVVVIAVYTAVFGPSSGAWFWIGVVVARVAYCLYRAHSAAAQIKKNGEQARELAYDTLPSR